MLLSLVFTLFAFNAVAVITSPMSNQFSNTGAVSNYEKSFIKVKNGESSAVPAGGIVVYSTTADNGATVASGSTAGMPFACVMESACAAGDVCLCQTKGYHSAVLFDAAAGGAVAGEAGFHSAVAYYVKSNDSAAAGNVPVGVFLDTISATGSVEMVLGF